jgi:aromatic ring-opening dioxygenase catalytic subunit (LigB family)
MDTLPSYFVSHGGGPWPFMKEQYGTTYDLLEASLREIARRHGKPRAALVITSHWEEAAFAISSGEHPGMIYDYGGFPPHTYHVRYPAPGDPALAARVAGLLTAAGHEAALDPTRGFDHGTFSMLYPIYPEADVPVVQMSLKHGLDPMTHIEAGRALAPLRRDGVLILGSGLSFHNLHQFGRAGRTPSHEFDGWLAAAMTLPPELRTQAITHWDRAPSARLAHPREEHLLPMMVALGAAEHEPATRVYHEDQFFGNLAVSSYRFG